MSATAHAEAVVLAEGDILLGNPLGAQLGGVSEIYGACTSDTTLNGVEGIAFDVPAEVNGLAATLVTGSDNARSPSARHAHGDHGVAPAHSPQGPRRRVAGPAASTLTGMDLKALSVISLPDPDGTPHQLGRLWDDRTIILVFLRHFG